MVDEVDVEAATLLLDLATELVTAAELLFTAADVEAAELDVLVVVVLLAHAANTVLAAAIADRRRNCALFNFASIVRIPFPSYYTVENNKPHQKPLVRCYPSDFPYIFLLSSM